MYAVKSSHRARDHPRDGRLYSVAQSFRRASYPPTSFLREVLPVPYHTDEAGAAAAEEEEAGPEEGRRIRTSRVRLACVRRAFTTSVSEGSGWGSAPRHGGRRRR